jgi:OmpA-OmpF porin, OOP family
MKKTLRFGVAALACAAVHVPAYAQSRPAAQAPAAATPAWYLGAGIGYAKIEGALDSTSLPVAGATASSFRGDTQETSGKAFVGFNVNRYFAIEGSYVRLGSAFGAQRDVTGGATGTTSQYARVQGLGISALGIWPITDSFSVFGRLGTTRLTADITNTNSGLAGLGVANSSTTVKSSRFALNYGLGAKYDVTRNFAVRAELEWFKRATNTNDFRVMGANKTADFQSFTASGILQF